MIESRKSDKKLLRSASDRPSGGDGDKEESSPSEILTAAFLR
jgi:hypothetical protein